MATCLACSAAPYGRCVPAGWFHRAARWQQGLPLAIGCPPAPSSLAGASRVRRLRRWASRRRCV